MKDLLGKFNDGGPVFTYPILVLLLVVILIFVLGMLKKMEHQKTITLLSHTGWFTVAWGFLGRTFGLIHAFDMVAAHGELTPRLLADGLKMALIDPLFGIMVFLVARLGIIILVSRQKKVSEVTA